MCSLSTVRLREFRNVISFHNSPVGPPEVELLVEVGDVPLEELEVICGVDILRDHGDQERRLGHNSIENIGMTNYVH